MKIHLELSEQDVNRIIACIAERPLKEVADLWLNIKQQADPQFQQAEAALQAAAKKANGEGKDAPPPA